MDNILEIAILEMGRQKAGKPFDLLEVIKWIYPQDWKHFEKDLQVAADQLKELGKIKIVNRQICLDNVN